MGAGLADRSEEWRGWEGRETNGDVKVTKRHYKKYDKRGC